MHVHHHRQVSPRPGRSSKSILLIADAIAIGHHKHRRRRRKRRPEDVEAQRVLGRCVRRHRERLRGRRPGGIDDEARGLVAQRRRDGGGEALGAGKGDAVEDVQRLGVLGRGGLEGAHDGAAVDRDGRRGRHGRRCRLGSLSGG